MATQAGSKASTPAAAAAAPAAGQAPAEADVAELRRGVTVAWLLNFTEEHNLWLLPTFCCCVVFADFD